MHNYQFEKFPLSGLHSLFFINYMDIVFVEANRSYCEIFMINGEKKLCAKSLGEVEKKLPSTIFFRCHQSFVINLNYLQEYNKKENIITLCNDISVPLAIKRKELFFEMVKYYLRKSTLFRINLIIRQIKLH